LTLVTIWIYLFLYSRRHNIDAPSGFSVIVIGQLVSGYSSNFFCDNYRFVCLSIDSRFLVCLFCVLWNIDNIQRFLYVGTANKKIWFYGMALIVGLLLGFYDLSVIGVGSFQVNAVFTVTALVFVVIQKSIAEEILHRGYFLNNLRKYGFHPIAAIFFESLIFTAGHIPGYYNNWLALFGVFSLGVSASYFSWKSNSLIPAIVLHLTANLFGTIWWLTT